MSIQSKAVQIARGEVGYVEGPRRNQSKYAAARFPSVNFQPWCGSFVGWVYQQAGFDLGKHVWIPSTQMTEAWARKHGFWKTSGQREGDLVIYGFGGSKAKHVGIAWPDPGASGYRAIEGNTSPGSAGSQRNGGGVYVRYRGRKSIRGWVDMQAVIGHYVGTKAVESVQAVAEADGALVVDGVFGAATAQEFQERMKHSAPALVVDRRIGPASIRAGQAHEGTPVDGFLSGQTETAVRALPAFRRDCIRLGGGGSAWVRALQTNLNGWGYGLTVDGIFGPATVRALQDAMNKHAGALL